MQQAIIGVLVGIGLYLVLMDLFKIPYSKTSQAVDNISKKQKNKASLPLFTILSRTKGSFRLTKAAYQKPLLTVQRKPE